MASLSTPPFPNLATAFVEGAQSAAPQVITVIGSGGKTSLIWLLAQHGRRQKTLVTTTTHMNCPPQEAGVYDYLLDVSGLAPDTFEPRVGISLAGVRDAISGKYGALPSALLASLIPAFDLVLIEGDGSRMLPLKAWAAYEPVVPASTTLTIGILPLWPVGLPVSQDIIHRLPLFSTLSGARIGEPLTLQHLVPVITGERENKPAGKGLFSEARGEQILFFNQIEDPRGLEQAEQLVSLFPAAFRAGLKKIIAGSVHPHRGFKVPGWQW